MARGERHPRPGRQHRHRHARPSRVPELLERRHARRADRSDGALRDDARSRVVIVTGAAPVFSAGAHFPARRGMSAEERRQVFLSTPNQFRRLFERVTTLLENLEQATIAMVNGHAIGGGFGLTLACDFRWAAAEAMFAIPEVDLGVPLGVASTTRFVRLVGPARAKEIIMECRRYTAADAHAMGLVHRVVPGDAARRRGTRVRRDPRGQAVRPARPGQGPYQRDRAHRHPRGQRDDRGVPRPRVKE